ncbi:MAG: hypothetical protein COU82_01585 [Candidatus Portnoybacteria bacterium CG10_big_fil_rev_8_21_14_0_10_38_18]|uniref:Cell wall hydrolase SleB domain-containing protein n=1 Tax=Candidatus Portnoybacteria bacterium CG10_big_fil_rev_8_21_14_0_10_38_18 TaxID=1974813 RepID=A0A2M8KC78_9BACT|nr:MAG: hypothetical protein COU82_01585 [Candidatus Portnoybacteria bacterium CG10_big_fil_rev_8_21_14_0_10_38_18]
MKLPTKITRQYKHSFKVSKLGLIAISISARCESRKQLNSNKDEDLRAEIDDRRFREIPPEKNIQLFNIPASWNGSKLKGLKKTIVFLTVLNKGEHTISLIPQNSALIEDIKIEELSKTQNPTFNLEEQAEDGDRRPWYVFVLVDLPLKTITAKVTTKYRWWDSDDVKLIIDGEIQKNKLSLFHRYWFWAGSLVKKLLRKETKEHTFETKLVQGTHYIEFWADKTPILHKVELDVGERIEFKRIPTVDDPEWTGDLEDDPEDILLARVIYGEAGGTPKLAKIAVGWSIRNRVEDSQHRWGDTYHEIILREKQYDSLWNKETRQKVRVPPIDNKLEEKAWQDSYKAARQVINSEVKDLTSGANHFYSIYVSKPDWAEEEKFIFSVDNLRFYKL